MQRCGRSQAYLSGVPPGRMIILDLSECSLRVGLLEVAQC
jgi:hypothetical protein